MTMTLSFEMSGGCQSSSFEMLLAYIFGEHALKVSRLFQNKTQLKNTVQTFTFYLLLKCNVQTLAAIH